MSIPNSEVLGAPEFKVGDDVAVRIINEGLGVPVTDWRGKIYCLPKNGKVLVEFRGGKKGKGKRQVMPCDLEDVHLLDENAAAERQKIQQDLVGAFIEKAVGEPL